MKPSTILRASGKQATVSQIRYARDTRFNRYRLAYVGTDHRIPKRGPVLVTNVRRDIMSGNLMVAFQFKEKGKVYEALATEFDTVEQVVKVSP